MVTKGEEVNGKKLIKGYKALVCRINKFYSSNVQHSDYS